MKSKKLIALLTVTTLTMSVLCTGCQQVSPASASDATSVSENLTQTQEPTMEPTTAPASEPTITPTKPPLPEEGDSHWSEGKLSGKQEDFDAYFSFDVKPCKQKCDTAGEVNEISYESAVLGATRQAFVYTPYNYDPAGEYPVVYLIHGLGCDGTQWVSMSAAHIFDNMIASGELVPCIAVFPSVVPVGGLDSNSMSATNIQAFSDFEKEYKEDLAPYIQANYAVSSKRDNTAVCGLSMGGMEALSIGFSCLDCFNYIGSFSAAPTLNTALLTTKDSEYVPELVLVCSGDKDSTVQSNPFNYHIELAKNHVDHIWYQHPGGGHSGNVWDLGLYNFLRRIF